MKQLSHISTRDLIRYAEGEVTTSEASEIEAAIKVSSRDRGRLAEIHEIAQHLKKVDEEVEEIDIVSDVRNRINELGSSEQKTPKRGVLKVVLAIAACLLVAAPLTIVLMQQGLGEEDEFRAKKAGPVVDEREQWIGLGTYRLETDSPTPLNASMKPSDELLFSYTNAGSSPFKYLMVFAVDEKGTVYWYYPAYEQEDTDPVSVPIQSKGRHLELPDRIGHEYREGALTIYGLFSDSPIPVSKIEKMVEDLVNTGSWSPENPPRLTIAGTGQKIIQTRVTK